MALKAIDGRQSGLQSAKDEILQDLRRAIDIIESGEIEPSKMMLILFQDDLDTFEFCKFIVGRYTQLIGIMEVVKARMTAEMLE